MLNQIVNNIASQCSCNQNSLKCEILEAYKRIAEDSILYYRNSIFGLKKNVTDKRIEEDLAQIKLLSQMVDVLCRASLLSINICKQIEIKISIGLNGNWFIDDIDTGIFASNENSYGDYLLDCYQTNELKNLILNEDIKTVTISATEPVGSKQNNDIWINVPETIITETYWNININPVETDSMITNFPCYVNLSHMPDSFWNSFTANKIIRMYDSNNNSLQVEIVSIDTSSKTGELWVSCNIGVASNTIIKIKLEDNED